jgi:hypothetical protein
VQTKLVRFFIRSAAVLLLITAVAEWIASSGPPKTLQTPDPFLSLPFRYLLWAVGGIQLIIALVCAGNKRVWLPAASVVWLATSFTFYRLGLFLTDYQLCCCSGSLLGSAPCCSDSPCIGDLTVANVISLRTADTIAVAMAAYLLIGGCCTLFWWWKRMLGATH